MEYKEITKEEAHNMTVTGYKTSKNAGLEFEKRKLMSDINILIKYGFDATFAVYKNDMCDGYSYEEDFLLKDYKDIKKWLLSLGYSISLFPPDFVPCNQHFMTVKWR